MPTVVIRGSVVLVDCFMSCFFCSGSDGIHWDPIRTVYFLSLRPDNFDSAKSWFISKMMVSTKLSAEPGESVRSGGPDYKGPFSVPNKYTSNSRKGSQFCLSVHRWRLVATSRDGALCPGFVNSISPFVLRRALFWHLFWQSYCYRRYAGFLL